MFSIASAAIFGVLGVLYGASAIDGVGVVLAGVTLNVATSWALTGLMFIMAYFSLVHLRHES